MPLLPLQLSVEDLLQVGIQEHSSGIQFLPDGTELLEARVHLLEVSPSACVGLVRHRKHFMEEVVWSGGKGKVRYSRERATPTSSYAESPKGRQSPRLPLHRAEPWSLTDL